MRRSPGTRGTPSGTPNTAITTPNSQRPGPVLLLRRARRRASSTAGSNAARDHDERGDRRRQHEQRDTRPRDPARRRTRTGAGTRCGLRATGRAAADSIPRRCASDRSAAPPTVAYATPSPAPYASSRSQIATPAGGVSRNAVVVAEEVRAHRATGRPPPNPPGVAPARAAAPRRHRPSPATRRPRSPSRRRCRSPLPAGALRGAVDLEADAGDRERHQRASPTSRPACDGLNRRRARPSSRASSITALAEPLPPLLGRLAVAEGQLVRGHRPVARSIVHEMRAPGVS